MLNQYLYYDSTYLIEGVRHELVHVFARLVSCIVYGINVASLSYYLYNLIYDLLNLNGNDVFTLITYLICVIASS